MPPLFSKSWIVLALLFGSIVFAGATLMVAFSLKKNPQISFFLVVLTIIGATMYVLQYWGGLRSQAFRKIGRLVTMIGVVALFLLFCVGCATGPYGNDYREYLERPAFSEDFGGKISVDDQTGYQKGESNFRENPKIEILNEVNRSKKNVIEDNPDVELHFTYYKCEQKELFPTQSEPLNGLIAVGTLGIWPIGSIKTCKTELVVRDVKTGKNIDTFSTTLEARRGGSFYMYMFGVRSMFMSKGSWGLPARRLLLQYQENLKAKK